MPQAQESTAPWCLSYDPVLNTEPFLFAAVVGLAVLLASSINAFWLCIWAPL